MCSSKNNNNSSSSSKSTNRQNSNHHHHHHHQKPGTSGRTTPRPSCNPRMTRKTHKADKDLLPFTFHAHTHLSDLNINPLPHLIQSKINNTPQRYCVQYVLYVLVGSGIYTDQPTSPPSILFCRITYPSHDRITSSLPSPSPHNVHQLDIHIHTKAYSNITIPKTVHCSTNPSSLPTYLHQTPKTYLMDLVTTPNSQLTLAAGLPRFDSHQSTNNHPPPLSHVLSCPILSCARIEKHQAKPIVARKPKEPRRFLFRGSNGPHFVCL
ncbi:hypothetical protein BO99DRAFT_101836 [Aspergillus violaceofuscus CBS 115571]|uniref:Uncharacterized protein n=1 Tax=Aspergillus violaceofuscus (strain CBS 115571) TaxID=1450538 RepID=A0A2V5HG50_ASPV1|nr:hypothetical protein BO99DRAFT_101836 [Aspergillus violaceofuscus CBS 115571]